MHLSVKEIFDEECGHVKIDQKFFRKVCEIEARFVNKKQEHIEFFGGTLTGVQVVRFTTDDFDKVFNDLLEVDESILEDRIHALPDINTEWKVSSSIFNLACVWIMHAIENSEYLDTKQKEEGKIRICLYLNYRILTSVLFRFFKYPANPETAAATYAQLSYKYILKAKGSWGAALRFRSEEVVGKDSIHYDTIKKLNNDYNIVKMLNDVQGRIKDMVKNIYSVFIKVHEQGSKIVSSHALVETDGEVILKDKTKSLITYTRYIRSVIPDKNSFIRQELFNVITDVVNTAPPHMLTKSLNWLSVNYNHIQDDTVEKTIELIMEHAFDYLTENKGVLRNKGDIANILTKIRGTYNSSRANDTKLNQIKESAELMIRMATGSKNASIVSAVRTAFCLYIILRAFTMRHYSSG
jgi:hypothetical protein